MKIGDRTFSEIRTMLFFLQDEKTFRSLQEKDTSRLESAIKKLRKLAVQRALEEIESLEE